MSRQKYESATSDAASHATDKRRLKKSEVSLKPNAVAVSDPQIRVCGLLKEQRHVMRYAGIREVAKNMSIQLKDMERKLALERVGNQRARHVPKKGNGSTSRDEEPKDRKDRKDAPKCEEPFTIDSVSEIFATVLMPVRR